MTKTMQGLWLVFNQYSSITRSRPLTFSSLPQTVQDEIVQLSQRYGQPLEHLETLPIQKPFDPLNKKDRYGEVCMVVRRKNGRLLIMKKTYYPTEAYRLLTGGISHGETIFDALLRETAEETGLDVAVNRFLVAAAYRLQGKERPRFYTFAFLLDEIGGTLGVVDDGEQVEDFREIEPDELLATAERLEHIGKNYSKKIGGRWQDWGHFRAVIHRLVGKAMAALPA
jgi:8-oxo-dGTP pyrophosphatase MutT (NUDIX family)